MAFFSSRREKHLWIWTAVVLIAVFSTLGLGGIAAQAQNDVGVGLFIFCSLLMLATVITQGLKSRPSGREVAVALGIITAYTMIFVRITSPVERSHIFEYGVVAVFIFEALQERAANGRRVPIPALLAILSTASIGVLDECLQLFITNRVFDPLDMVFNSFAAVMAVGSSAALSRVRRKR